MWNWDHPKPTSQIRRCKVKCSPENKDSWSPPGDGEMIEFGLCDCGPSGAFLFVLGFFIFLFRRAKKAMENTLIDSGALVPIGAEAA